MPSIGGFEWIVILLIVILLFGASRIPQVARSLGKSVSEFKKGLREGEEEAKDKPGDDKGEKKDEKS